MNLSMNALLQALNMDGIVQFLGIIILLVIIFLFFMFIRCFRIVPQAHVFVIERFGSFKCEWETGIHFLWPFIERIAGKVSLKEKVVDFKPQPVITKDNVTMQIDTVVFYKVTNAKQYIYGVERPLAAIENLSATTLRNIIGELELDSTLTSRDTINTNITAILDQATDRWGIKVERVELKNIIPPREIQDAMEKQIDLLSEKLDVPKEELMDDSQIEEIFKNFNFEVLDSYSKKK